MRKLRETLGYLIGGLTFVLLIPALMWLLSGRPDLLAVPILRLLAAIVIALLGLALSIWSIVHMRRRGDGNPMDAFGHEVAPRTKHLMTDGPYRLSRNPMLTGSFIYYAALCLLLLTWPALLVFAAFIAVMLLCQSCVISGYLTSLMMQNGMAAAAAQNTNSGTGSGD